MNSCVKDVAAFLSKELKTLEFLAGQYGRAQLQEIATAAQKDRYHVSKRGFSTSLAWSVIHKESGNIYDIHIGGLGECRDGMIKNLSYSLTVTKEKDGVDDEHVIVRKYHFDYTCPINEQRRPHPVFHLQLPGEILPWMEGRYTIDHLCPELSEPRILYFPMSLVLVLHIAFSEFGDEYTDEIIHDGGWLGLVRSAQEMLWKPYMETCLEHIQRKRIILNEAYAT